MPGEWSPFIKKGETGGWGRSRFSRAGRRGRGGNTNITFRYAMFKTVQDIAMTLSAESGWGEEKRKELKEGTVEDTAVECLASSLNTCRVPAHAKCLSAGVSAILPCLYK